MKIKIKFLKISVYILSYTLIFISLICLNSQAQGATGIGNYGATFLQVNSGAKQVAMADAYTALAYDDINLMRYNIGGLGTIRNIMLAVNYHNWIDDTKQGTIGLALPTVYGVIGVDLTYFNEGKLTELNENFRRTGNILESNDIALSLGYGGYFKFFKRKLLFGGGVKIIRQNLAQESASAVGVDLGMMLWLKHLSFGMTVQNFGTSKLKFIEEEEPLPETYRAGLGGHFYIGDHVKWNIDFDFAYLPEENYFYYSGTEVIINNLLMIRAGYKFHDFDTNRWAAGMGLLIPMPWLASSETRLDYAYTPLDAFDSSTHRFSLLFRFGVPIPGRPLNIPDDRKLAALNEKLRRELKAAERARLAAEEAEMRTRALEDTMRARLARIKQIAEQSDGKIEVVETKDITVDEVGDKIHVSMRINFDFDKADIRTEEYQTMHRVAEILNTYPGSRVFVSGHADYIGTHEYNFRLSQSRVESVLRFLIAEENIDYNRFYNPIGYGKLKPVADNTTEEGRFRNRRVDFIIYTGDDEHEMPEASAIKAVELINSSTIHIVGNGKLKFDHKLWSDPYRLVLDFPYTFLQTDKSTYEIYRGPFIRARIGYHPDKIFSRVVFDLFEPIQYEIEAVDNLAIIRLR